MNRASQLVVYVDVDDTLMRSAGTKRLPIPTVLKHVRQLKERGALIYCWSAVGADYARSTAASFGIADCFIDFLPKPNVMLDDQPPAAWPRFVIVHPLDIDDSKLQSYFDALGPASDAPDEGSPS